MGDPRTLRAVVIVVGMAAAVLVAQLFVEPIVGLADNGDFVRVMAPAGLHYPTESYFERYWSWMLRSFPMGEPWIIRGHYPTSESLLVSAAVSASRAVGRDRVFDIRFLAAVHALLLLLFLAAVTVATQPLAPVARWLVRILSVLVWTDVGYVAPFNSFYTQVSSLLFLLLTAGVTALAVRRGSLSGWLLPAFFVCSALFVVSKPQEIVQAPLLAFLAVRLRKPAGAPVWRSPSVWLGAALCALAAWSYGRIPEKDIREVGLYQSVFMELLRTSPSPEQDLRDLGVETELVQFTGRAAYAPGAPLGLPDFRAQFFDRVGFGSVLRFYLTHPARLMNRLQRAGLRAFQIRPPGLGNFEQVSGRRALEQSRHFDAWSTLRSYLGARGLAILVLLLGGNLLAAFVTRRSGGPNRLFGEAVAVLVVMVGLEFGVCTFADSLADLPRHLFVFHAMIDLLLIADAGWIASVLARRRAAARPVSAPA